MQNYVLVKEGFFKKCSTVYVKNDLDDESNIYSKLTMHQALF